MGFVISPEDSPLRRRIDVVELALCFCGGMICGLSLSLRAGSSLSPLMRSAAFGSVSITPLLCSALFPFLISAFAVFLSRSALLAICFGKALLFSFTALGIAQAFGGAGWLVCLLVLFSDAALMPLLYFFWLRLLAGKISVWGAVAVIALAVLIVSIDHRIVSPFLASLIEIQKG